MLTDYLQDKYFWKLGCLQYLRITFSKQFSTVGMLCVKLVSHPTQFHQWYFNIEAARHFS